MLSFFVFDMNYLLLVMLPGMVLAGWAQSRLRSAYDRGNRQMASSGLTGAQTAQRILDMQGIHNVRIEREPSFLGDHYDPRNKVLRLSPDVYDGRTIASVGIAAHEVGHAIQDARRYGALVVRNGMVPLASTGSSLSMIVLMAGLFIQSSGLLLLGVGLFSLTVIFQIVNLPVEFDASRRARAVLVDGGIVTPQEDPLVGKVLNAAALTYVAATVTAILQLVWFLMQALGSRE